MIGSFSKVGNETSIHGTVIGNSCLIGDGVSITDAHLWDNVTIEDGATICEAVLCNDCLIKKGAVFPKGCVIGRGCVIDENTKIQSCRSFQELLYLKIKMTTMISVTLVTILQAPVIAAVTVLIARAPMMELKRTRRKYYHYSNQEYLELMGKEDCGKQTTKILKSLMKILRLIQMMKRTWRK